MTYYLIASLSCILGLLVGLMLPRKNDMQQVVETLKDELKNKQMLVDKFVDLSAQLFNVKHNQQIPIAPSMQPQEEEPDPLNDLNEFADVQGGAN